MEEVDSTCVKDDIEKIFLKDCRDTNNPVLEMTARLDIVEKLVTVNSKLVAL